MRAGENPNGTPTPHALRVSEELGLLAAGELEELVEAEDARAELRREWGEGVEDPARRREISNSRSAT